MATDAGYGLLVCLWPAGGKEPLPSGMVLQADRVVERCIGSLVWARWSWRWLGMCCLSPIGARV